MKERSGLTIAIAAFCFLVLLSSEPGNLWKAQAHSPIALLSEKKSALPQDLQLRATVINPSEMPTIPGTGSRTFPETGQSLTGIFLDYWNNHGGLMQQGFPISGLMTEVSDLDAKPYIVQYFERAVFEFHPENPPPYNVLLSQLGTFRYKDRYPAGASSQKPNNVAGSVLFPQTGHRVGGVFLTYWEQHGGVAQQGYPISDEFTEVSDLDAKPYTVQYFERAVFEMHPENKPPYNVLLSQLGTFRYKNKYQQPTTPTAVAVSPTPTQPEVITTPTTQSTATSAAPAPTSVPVPTEATIPPQPSGEKAEVVMEITNDQMQMPWGLALGPDGNIYVTSKDYVLKFDKNGKLLMQFGSSGTGEGQFNFLCQNNPTYNCGAVAVDTSGNVYLADSGNSRVQKFDQDGHFLMSFGTKGSAEGQMLNPIDIAVDSEGNIYIVDDVNLGVRKYDNAGRYVATLAGSSSSKAPVSVQEPVGLAVDGNDNVYVVDDVYNSVFKFGKDGKLLLTWGRLGTLSGEFNYTKDVTTDSAGNVYVLDGRSVQKFTANGAWQMKWGSPGTGPGQFQSPASIAVDAQGYVYVLESGPNRLQKFQIK